eukprot:TRINITY_DN8540_c0_g1_i7.p1 TRINITY_DN8540_c0_g1~~TRINITY_DN8540_c0_g1_i7.p1  ORF type:complete len:422 (-),score=45.50 TRINITY_DN8540_c0_g1_i7:235-1434(-)
METPQIDGYILLEELGSGASGTVFSARKRRGAVANADQDECAVKVYSGERATERFCRELSYLRKVCGHPNVVDFLSYHEGVLNAIVMPLYHGPNPDALVRRHRGLPEVAAALVLKDLLAATQHVHHRGVLHRDIKPENILVSDGRAVLVDFDVACPISQVDDPDLRRAGTAGYMSPEMASRMPYSMPTDLFSIGCTLYFMFRKRPPFRTSPHSTNAVLCKTIVCKFQFDVWFDDVSEACKHMISSLVVREPAERLSIEQALQHVWLTPSAFSSRTSVGSCAPSGDEDFVPLSKPDAVAARARRLHQPSVSSVCDAKPSNQSSQEEVRSSSDAQQFGKNATPRARSCRRRMSRKPEPRRPNGDPHGPQRSTFRKHTGESFAHQHTEPVCHGSAAEAFDAQ